MKKIYYLIVTLIGLISLTGCFDDPGTEILLSEEFVSFSVESQQTSETDGEGAILVEVSFAQQTDLTVNFEVETNNAIEGIDFTLTGGASVVIPAGDFSASIPYTITDNDVFEPSARSFTVRITGVTGVDGIGVEGVGEITVAILNDDCPANTSVWFGAITVVDVGFSSEEGLGAANDNGDCDILVVTGNYVGATSPIIWDFTPESPGATNGTVIADRQRYFCCSPEEYEYEATGTYDEVTGVIEADYNFYRTDGSLWFTGTTQITTL
ncbi:MAG: Calx-beta domain-containing protein [Bacteroidota bacterium]